MVEHQAWHRLDNAGKLFPSVTSSRQTHIFRLSATLKVPVVPPLLQRALEGILPRFPLFSCRIHGGFFWFSLAEDPRPPTIFPDSASPCMPFKEKCSHLFRVRWYRNRIAVEFNHALTDGMGACVFFRALVCSYLELTGIQITQWADVPRAGDPPQPEESEDAVARLFIRNYPVGESPAGKTFLLPFGLYPQGAYRVITGRLPLDRSLEVAKQYGLTLNEFLAVVYLLAFQEVFEGLPAPLRKKLTLPLRLVVPYNLRKNFPSKTLRNYFIVLSIELDLRLGHYEFGEVVRKVHHLLQAEMDEKLILKQVARNLRGERHPLSRMAPLFLKNLVLSSVFNRYEKQHTSSLSNLGRMIFPSEAAELIDHCDFIPPPSPVTKVNAGVVSFGNVLSISLGSQTRSTELERAFFSLLRKMGIPIRLETNRERLEES